ncbi:MAG: hypothetical protein WCO19_04165 [Candidatus Saccharibacteria bacterium]
MFKKFGSAVSQFVVITALMLAILMATVCALITSSHLKHWLSDSGVYTSAPELITDKISKETKSSQSSDPINSPLVTQAALKTLSPKFLSSTSESLIDSGFNWLNGTTKDLRLVIPVEPIRKDFTQYLEDLIYTRYEALPACAPRTLPSTSDLLTINCKVGALPTHEALKNYIDQTIDDSGIFTSKNIKDGSIVVVKDADSKIPKAYRSVRLIPIAFSLLVLIAGAGVILTSESKKNGTAKLGRILVSTGLFTISILWLCTLLLVQAENKIYESITDLTARNGIHELHMRVRDDLLRTGISYALIPIVIGCIVVIVLFINRKLHEPKKIHEVPKPKPEPLPEPKPKAEPALTPKPEPKTVKTPEPKTAPIPKQPPKPKLVNTKDSTIIKPTQDAEYK